MTPLLSRLACVVCLSVLIGCMPPTQPPGDNEPDTTQAPDSKDDSGLTSGPLASAVDALERTALSIVAIRLEDSARRKAAGAQLRAQSLFDVFNGPCLNGGTRDVAPDGTMTFDGCVVFPGLELDGGVRIVPAPERQGGRIDFFDLHGKSDGVEFRVDGSMEEIETEDGLIFKFDLRSTTDDGEYNDEFNATGELFVDDDGKVFGNLDTDTGNKFEEQRPTRCAFDGQDLAELLRDPEAFDRLCPEQAYEPFAVIDPGIEPDPRGLELAGRLFEDLGAGLEVIGPSNTTPNTLFGVAFENGQAYARLDSVGLNVVGFSVEDRGGRFLYSVDYRYRGLTMRLGTGDVLELDVREDGTTDVWMMLNSTAPPSRIAMRMDPAGNVFLNSAETVFFAAANPDYGLKAAPPAKPAQRAAGIRLTRDACVGAIGAVRALGLAACDVKDVLTGALITQAADAMCVAGKRALSLGDLENEDIGVANLSLTVLCESLKAAGIGARIVTDLTPVGIGCKLLSVSSDLVNLETNQNIEDLVCARIASGNWVPNYIHVLAFRNADGSTEQTADAEPDITLIAFEDDLGHPEIRWSAGLVPRAEYMILTRESPSEGQSVLYWLRRDANALPQIGIRYGEYSRGVRGVTNVPYPAPALRVLPEGAFYRLRIKLEDGPVLELQFRLQGDPPAPDLPDFTVDTVDRHPTLYRCNPDATVDLQLELQDAVTFPITVSLELTDCVTDWGNGLRFGCVAELMETPMLVEQTFTIQEPDDFMLSADPYDLTIPEIVATCPDVAPEIHDRLTATYIITVTDADGRTDDTTLKISCCDLGGTFCADSCPE